MKRRRFLFLTAFALVFICGLAVGAGAAGSSQKITASLDYALKVQYNDRVQNLTDAAGQRVYPIVYNNTTYLPIRSISNMLGVKVDWDQASYTALIGENTTRPPAAVQLPAGLVGKELQNWPNPRYGYIITFNADGSFTYESIEPIVVALGIVADWTWNVDVVSTEKTGSSTFLLHLGAITYAGGTKSQDSDRTPIPEEDADPPPFKPWSTIQLALPGTAKDEILAQKTEYDSRAYHIDGTHYYENRDDQIDDWADFVLTACQQPGHKWPGLGQPESGCCGTPASEQRTASAA